jgi:hypothetical protein
MYKIIGFANKITAPRKGVKRKLDDQQCLEATQFSFYSGLIDTSWKEMVPIALKTMFAVDVTPCPLHKLERQALFEICKEFLDPFNGGILIDPAYIAVRCENQLWLSQRYNVRTLLGLMFGRHNRFLDVVEMPEFNLRAKMTNLTIWRDHQLRFQVFCLLSDTLRKYCLADELQENFHANRIFYSSPLFPLFDVPKEAGSFCFPFDLNAVFSAVTMNFQTKSYKDGLNDYVAFRLAFDINKRDISLREALSLLACHSLKFILSAKQGQALLDEAQHKITVLVKDLATMPTNELRELFNYLPAHIRELIMKRKDFLFNAIKDKTVLTSWLTALYDKLIGIQEGRNTKVLQARTLESTTMEFVGSEEIKEESLNKFYDDLGSLKGVQAERWEVFKNSFSVCADEGIRKGEARLALWLETDLCPKVTGDEDLSENVYVLVEIRKMHLDEQMFWMTYEQNEAIKDHILVFEANANGCEAHKMVLKLELGKDMYVDFIGRGYCGSGSFYFEMMHRLAKGLGVEMVKLTDDAHLGDSLVRQRLVYATAFGHGWYDQRGIGPIELWGDRSFDGSETLYQCPPMYYAALRKIQSQSLQQMDDYLTCILTKGDFKQWQLIKNKYEDKNICFGEFMRKVLQGYLSEKDMVQKGLRLKDLECLSEMIFCIPSKQLPPRILAERSLLLLAFSTLQRHQVKSGRVADLGKPVQEPEAINFDVTVLGFLKANGITRVPRSWPQLNQLGFPKNIAVQHRIHFSES